MNTVRINGVTIQGSKNVVVTNGKVIIDGQDVTPDDKTIIIRIDGNVDTLHVDACNSVTVYGNVESLKTISGDVNVEGSIGESVQTVSGDVDCGNVNGSIKTVSGDIKHRKA